MAMWTMRCGVVAKATAAGAWLQPLLGLDLDRPVNLEWRSDRLPRVVPPADERRHSARVAVRVGGIGEAVVDDLILELPATVVAVADIPILLRCASAFGRGEIKE